MAANNQKEEWRLCAEWLVRCKILASDHRVTWPTAEVFDLAQTLRDGVLICHLLNALKAGVIDTKDFSQRPQMSQFLCLKNIRTFLQTCRMKFSLKEADLFDSYDLFDMKNFGKVIHTLSKLSKCPEAAKSGISGFPPSNIAVRRNSDYYNTLEELATKVEVDDEPIYDVGTGDDDVEDIYGEIMYRKQSPKRPSQPALPAGVTFEPKSQRDYCIKELVETERNYVEALNMIMSHFIRPLRTVLSPEANKVVFFGVEQLHTIHTGFHSEIQKSVSDKQGHHKNSVADCFIKWKPKFLIYGEFCSNLTKAQDMVDELARRNPMIAQNIEECQLKANDGKFRLRDLLAVPMQRVLKYHLLLKELIKKTDDSHPERRSLEKALEAMQDLSLYVNEVKRDDEALQLINEIQHSIVDLAMPENTSLKDYGKLLKDGELMVRSHDDNRPRKRYIFLFDKVMMMCKSRGETYSYKHALILSQHKVDEGHNIQKQKQDKWAQFFLLVEKQNTRAYTFAAKTEEMRRKWIDAIAMAMDNTQPPGATDHGHEFVMHSFDEPTTCNQCDKLLRGVFYQGYKCTRCDRNVHKECIIKARSCQSGGPHLPPRRKDDPVVPARPPPTPDRSSVGSANGIFRTAIGKCKANYSYQGIPAPDDNRPVIKFEVDSMIDLLNDSDDYWWEGRINGATGFFPAQYVTKRVMRRQSYEPAEPSLRVSVPPPSPSVNTANGSYVNLTDLSQFQWYVGEMDRSVAMQRLEKHASGSYLVRASNNPSRKGEYALSIKFGSSSKHIKINRTGDNMFYIADCKMFRSIPELVEYYQKTTLEYSFPELRTTLVLAYKDAVRQMSSASKGASGPQILGYCRANYDYSANQPNQLSLRKDDRIGIISRAGEDRGWWKGQLRGKVGYFPMAYVVEESEEDALAGQLNNASL